MPGRLTVFVIRCVAGVRDVAPAAVGIDEDDFEEPGAWPLALGLGGLGTVLVREGDLENVLRCALRREAGRGGDEIDRAGRDAASCD